MDIRSTLSELCEAFNAHDLDRIMACFSDDCVLEMPRALIGSNVGEIADVSTDDANRHLCRNPVTGTIP